MVTTLLSPKETAALLRVDLRTVYRWCAAKRIPAEKFGGIWRIRLELPSVPSEIRRSLSVSRPQ